jgi:dipeptidyl aminopeptidase/acylaminoacyl peptidase
MRRNRCLVITLTAAGLIGAMLACHPPMPPEAEPTSTSLPPEATAPPAEASPLPESPTEAATAELHLTPTVTPRPGEQIVYTKGGNLWIVEGDAAPRQLTSGGTDDMPLLSLDGRRVLYRRDVGIGPADVPRFEYRVVNSDGSGDRRLMAPGDLPGELGTPAGGETEVMLDRVPAQVAWLPDGRVAFNTAIEGGYGVLTKDDLWLIDVADVHTSTLIRLLPDGQGGAFAFSPDGSRVVVSTPTSVAMLNADGSGRRTLVSFEPVNTASEYAYCPQPVWMPDGAYALIAISSPEPFGPAEEAAADLWRLPLEGDAVRMATLVGRFLFNTMADRLWSAERTRIAYTVPVGADGDEVELRLAAGDGSGSTVYDRGQLEFTAWAPRGERFVYQEIATSAVWLGEPGAAPRALLSPAGDDRVVDVQWVGDEALVCVVVHEGAYEILRVSLTGETRLLDTVTGSFPSLDALP